MNYNSAAATANGQVLSTTKIATSMQGETQIRFTLIAEANAENFHIKAAAWRGVQPRKSVTFEGQDWASQDEFERYYNNFGTQVVSLKIVTDNVDNFNGELIFTHKSPTGRPTVIPRDLSKYKVESAKADGYSDTVIINDLPFPLGPHTDLQISEIKAGSKMKFFMNIAGETKVMELTPIQSERF